jgi:hypothetical protein
LIDFQATGVMSDSLKYKPPEEWQRKFDKLGSNDENVLGVLLEVGENNNILTV